MSEPILADTSVWIASFRQPSSILNGLGRNRRLRTHPYVIGELALGSFARRELTLTSLSRIRHVKSADHDDVIGFIEREKLYGCGIGYVDAHLLAACLVTPGVKLWTEDKSLDRCARRLGIAATLTN